MMELILAPKLIIFLVKCGYFILISLFVNISLFWGAYKILTKNDIVVLIYRMLSCADPESFVRGGST